MTTDTFNRADGALAGSTTSDGTATWGSDLGPVPMKVSGNVAKTIAFGGTGQVLLSAGGTSGTVQATMTADTHNNQSLLYFRWIDASNHWWVQLAGSGALNIQVWVISGGSQSTQYSGTGASGDVIRVEFTTTTITVKRNGSTVYSATDSRVSSGTGVGIGTSNGSSGTYGASLDDFSWTPAAVPRWTVGYIGFGANGWA